MGLIQKLPDIIFYQIKNVYKPNEKRQPFVLNWKPQFEFDNTSFAVLQA